MLLNHIPRRDGSNRRMANSLVESWKLKLRVLLGLGSDVIKIHVASVGKIAVQAPRGSLAAVSSFLSRQPLVDWIEEIHVPYP